MKQIGLQLKKTREEKDITLEEVAEKTKIQSRYLQAVENGDWERLPEEVYLRGFIRTYAQFLGLDAQSLIKEYDEARAQEKEDREEEILEETSQEKSYLWIIILALIALGIIGYIGWYFWF